jgi:hypothetical protein
VQVHIYFAVHIFSHVGNIMSCYEIELGGGGANHCLNSPENCLCEFVFSMLRGYFLEYRVIGAQKYRHALRENGAICCFCENGWVKI